MRRKFTIEWYSSNADHFLTFAPVTDVTVHDGTCSFTVNDGTRRRISGGLWLVIDQGLEDDTTQV